jgi:hypothetical protein
MYDYEPDLTETTFDDVREGDEVPLLPDWAETLSPGDQTFWSVVEAGAWGDQAVRDFVSEIDRSGGRVIVETVDGRSFGPYAADTPIVVRRAIRESADA